MLREIFKCYRPMNASYHKSSIALLLLWSYERYSYTIPFLYRLNYWMDDYKALTICQARGRKIFAKHLTRLIWSANYGSAKSQNAQIGPF